MSNNVAKSEKIPSTSAEAEFRRLRLFAYTVEGRAPLYRAIMRVFAEGKNRFRIHFRPDQVRDELVGRGIDEALFEDGLERYLGQLTKWGNLRRIHDTGRANTIEDFRRNHFLYQITPAGEAAERAVGMVVDVLEDHGSLQAVMLGAISRNLSILVEELRRGHEEGDSETAPRPTVLYEALFNVREQFRALTENASIFLGRLHEAIDTSTARREEFMAYKVAVIAYLHDFMGELTETTPRIVRALETITAADVERMVTLAATADSAPVFDGQSEEVSRLRRRWRDITAWFLGEVGQPPIVESLHGAARAAIRRILTVLERMHEKRFRRADRSADLERLASWFEDEEKVQDVHGLFQDAFGLFSARHLGALDDDPELRLPHQSWSAAPSVELAPALRESGRRTTTGRASQIVDYSAARRRLRDAHRKRRQRREQALQRFEGHGALRLGELPLLGEDEFDLLLSLLDRLLTTPVDERGVRSTRSRDGRLALELQKMPGEQAAVVRTTRGSLRLPDYTLTVQRGVFPPRETAP